MAWLMRESIRMEDAPLIRWTPETIDEILVAHAEVVARYSHLSPNDPEFIEEGNVPAGLPIRIPAQPYEIKVSEVYGPLPDAIASTIVNDRIRVAVEAIEPGVHQFIPTILSMPDGTRDRSWWTLHVCHRIESLAYEHCVDVHDYLPQPLKYPTLVRYRSNEDRRLKLAVWKDKIAGKALWFDHKFSRIVLSEELGQYFLDNGIRGYRLRLEDDLNRSNHVIEV
jgi:hypothetical protein